LRWRFTDKVLFFSPWETILTLKAGSLEEYSLLDRWGEPGRAPPVLLLESCIQSARWLVEASSAFTLSCDPIDIACWRVPSGLQPGERYCIWLRVAERESGCIRFALRQKILAPGESPPAPEAWKDAEEDGLLVCAFAPLHIRCPPASRACLWQEISA
jgi:hypothetical protein